MFTFAKCSFSVCEASDRVDGQVLVLDQELSCHCVSSCLDDCNATSAARYSVVEHTDHTDLSTFSHTESTLCDCDTFRRIFQHLYCGFTTCIWSMIHELRLNNQMQKKQHTCAHIYDPPPNTYTHLIHLGWSPNVSALWHAKHSVNISQRMVTVTMAARQLKHGTVVLFNIWPRRSTACFYPIILSQERRLLRADVPTPLCSPT